MHILELSPKRDTYLYSILDFYRRPPMASKKLCHLLLISLVFAASSRASAEATGPGSIPAPVVELSRKVVDFGTHKVTYIRITPPALPALPAQPQTPTPTPTAEELAAQERRAAKAHGMLNVTGIVYVGSPTVTELTWTDDDGQRFRAWSNADFRLLTQLSTIETETHIFMWFPFISEGSVEEIPVENRPSGLSLFTANDTAPEYFFEGTDEDMTKAATTLAGLDYLHAFYQIHKTRLEEDYTRRMAEAAAQAEELAKNPPKPVDTVIHFWKNPAPASP